MIVSIPGESSSFAFEVVMKASISLSRQGRACGDRTGFVSRTESMRKLRSREYTYYSFQSSSKEARGETVGRVSRSSVRESESPLQDAIFVDWVGIDVGLEEEDKNTRTSRNPESHSFKKEMTHLYRMQIIRSKSQELIEQPRNRANWYRERSRREALFR